MSESMNDTGAPEVIEVSARRLVRAARDHTCSDCGEAILAWTGYWRGFLLVDGEPTVTKTHAPYAGACVSDRGVWG